MLTADLKLSPELPDHRVLAAAAAVSSATYLVILYSFVPFTADLVQAP